jgi:metal-responsive CopG/Arc/MetJ family transcriptional regulator
MDDTQFKYKEIGVVLTPDLARRSLEAAHDRGLSRSELIRELLTVYLAERELG